MAHRPGNSPQVRRKVRRLSDSLTRKLSCPGPENKDCRHRRYLMSHRQRRGTRLPRSPWRPARPVSAEAQEAENSEIVLLRCTHLICPVEGVACSQMLQSENRKVASCSPLRNHVSHRPRFLGMGCPARMHARTGPCTDDSKGRALPEAPCGCRLRRSYRLPL